VAVRRKVKRASLMCEPEAQARRIGIEPLSMGLRNRTPENAGFPAAALPLPARDGAG